MLVFRKVVRHTYRRAWAEGGGARDSQDSGWRGVGLVVVSDMVAEW